MSQDDEPASTSSADGSAESQTSPAGSGSLVSPLLSGRSLEPLQRRKPDSWVGRNRGAVIAGAVVLVAVVVVVGLKLLAGRAADSSTSTRVEELHELLSGARTNDFLAFDVGVRRKGSIAQLIRDQDGFMSVKAGADNARIRIQPSGWWSGFTERCIVVDVAGDNVDITVPNVSCVRVESRKPSGPAD